MEKRILPDFKSEAEEAKWWFDNQDELEKDFRQAAAEGRLGRGTAARIGKISSATIPLGLDDIACEPAVHKISDPATDADV